MHTLYYNTTVYLLLLSLLSLSLMYGTSWYTGIQLYVYIIIIYSTFIIDLIVTREEIQKKFKHRWYSRTLDGVYKRNNNTLDQPYFLISHVRAEGAALRCRPRWITSVVDIRCIELFEKKNVFRLRAPDNGLFNVLVDFTGTYYK